MPLILPRRSLLAYPAGTAPGFDPSHPLAENCQISMVANGANVINLLSGTVGALTGSPTSGVDGALGLSLGLANGPAAKVSFTLGSTVPSAVLTQAVIFKLSAIAAGNYQTIQTNSQVSGDGLLITKEPGGALGIFYNVDSSFVSSGVSPQAGVPYFMLASSKSSDTVNFVVVNLATGQVFTSSAVASGHGTLISGTLGIGTGNANQGLGGIYVAGLITKSFFKQAELQAWAADPWSFWYPNKAQSLTGTATPATATLYELMNW